MLVDRLRRGWQRGLDGERVLVLVPDRREARRLTDAIGPPPDGAIGRLRAMSYHSFAQDLIKRWWPLVAQQFSITAATPEFLPFNLTQFACLNEYRLEPGHLQRLTIREQRLIVQLLSNMNLSAANGLTLEEGWTRVAYGLGLSPQDDVIADGLRLTQRFRERCLRAGVLPEDVQVEAAGWLLGDRRVRDDLLTRFDLLAIDGLDEFVPLMAERLVGIASECKQAAIVCSDDGGLRWLLGASPGAAGRLCAGVVESGRFRRLCLTRTLSGSALAGNGSAAWLAGAVNGVPPASAPSFAGWTLADSASPVEMAGEVVSQVERLLAGGTAPNGIALLIPYMDTLISTEIERLCRQREIPFRIDRHWRSLLDEPLSRACLTALRCVNPNNTRHATLVEVADLVVALTDTNPIVAQPWAEALYDRRSGGLKEPRNNPGIPREVKVLGRWAERARESGELHEQLERLAKHVLAPHQSHRRRELVRACYALATDARRFAGAVPRLGLEAPHITRFFDYVDSNVVAADTGADPPDDSVLLTTPYAFLISGRVAEQQCWLNVASPSWWEPPLLLLTNPHALSGELSGRPATFEDDDRIRGRILGRVIRNLAARCDGDIHAFASYAGSDGQPLDGPLYDSLLEMRAVAR
ncbi:hypothetical protein BH23CHL1_BH23CHL1_15660 [soil metagenome]